MGEYDQDSLARMLKDVASSLLLSVLGKVEGHKDLVIGEQMIPVIDQFCNFKTLKTSGVEKIFKLENPPSSNTKKLCFLLKPTIAEVKKACNWLNVFLSKNITDLQYWIVFIPQRSFTCEHYLELEGLYSYFKIIEYPLGFIPIDYDLFSCESDDLYHDYLLLGDCQFVNNISLGLHQFQKLVGPINLMFSKGRASELICDSLHKMNALSGWVTEAPKKDMDIDLIAIDREEDFVSLFLSQLNYSGILDETFTIKCGKVELDTDRIKDPPPNKKHKLFGSDQIFQEVQDMSFSSVCVFLKEKGQYLRRKYHDRQKMNLTEMKDFLTNDLKNYQSENKALFMHINICESIMEHKKKCKFSEQLKVEQNLVEGIESRNCLNYVEDGIVKMFCKTSMLRLICLYSICNSGISNRDLHSLIKLYTQSYGYDSILTFQNLKKIGILFETSSQFNFVASNPTLKGIVPSYQGTSQSLTTSNSSENIKKFRHITKKFKLIPLLQTDSYNVRNPTDCGYVFGGAYLPYTSKIVDTFLELKSVSAIDEWCRQVQCKMQPLLVPNQLDGRNLANRNNRLLIVLIVGGVTFAEISAFRFLSRQRGVPILVMGTSITNANCFLETVASKSY